MSAQPLAATPPSYAPGTSGNRALAGRGAARAAALPAGSPTPAAAPRIHLVRAPASSRSRVPYVLFCMVLVAGALIGVLLLNTTMARGSYEARELHSQIAVLAQTEQALIADLDEKSSPVALAERARQLGMVQDNTPAFLRLSDGAIIGDPSPAQPAAGQ